MLVVAERGPLLGLVRRTAEIVAEAGGFVSPDLIVYESSGHFWCGVRGSGPHPRLLIDYPEDLAVPLSGIRWGYDTEALVAESGQEHLSPPQRALLELWLELVAETDKLTAINRCVPGQAVHNPTLRQHLAVAGYPDLHAPPNPAAAHEILLGWHSSRGRQQAAAAGRTERKWLLIPLKHLLNHHPDGAPQVPRPGRFAAVTSANSTERETFENYGDLDALHLLMRFGYVDSTARVVHSVPVTVESTSLGMLAVGRQPPRNPFRAGNLAQLPTIQRTDQGVQMSYLSARQGNREALRDLLSMVLQSVGGVPAPAARAEAERLIDAIAEANLRYYEGLVGAIEQADREAAAAGIEPPPIHIDLREVAHRQRDRLLQMWAG